MSDQETVINPFIGKAVSVDDYVKGNAEAKKLMDSIFTRFDFTDDFKRAYKQQSFTAIRPYGNGSLELEKQVSVTFPFREDKNKKAKIFIIDFSEGQTAEHFFVKSMSNFEGLTVHLVHCLEIAPQNYTYYHSSDFKHSKDVAYRWEAIARGLSMNDAEFSIEDTNPNNKSFIQGKDGRQLSGVCTLDDILGAKFQLQDSDTFILSGTKNGVRCIAQYSYIPLKELKLAGK